MHTYNWEDQVNFIYNGDFSGNVEISFIGTGIRIEIAMEALKEFMAYYVMTKRIEKLENSGTEEILLGGP
jgi:hypothetical protein